MDFSSSHSLRIALLGLVAVVISLGFLASDDSRHATAQLPASSTTPGPGNATVAATDRSTPAVAPARAPATLAAAAPAETAAPSPTVERRGGVACALPHTVVSVPTGTAVRAAPGGRTVGSLPSTSLYMGQPMTAWVQATTSDGRWGRITIPWGASVRRSGWVAMAGLQRESTRTMVVADLSERRLRVYRGCAELFAAPAAIGAAGSPSPTGRFWVTDRVAVPRSQPYFGSYAFGMSTIQPQTPAGWTGGNQMAIHGTNTPATIGTPASAGCLRVSERTLERLKPLLHHGTPIIIEA